MKLLLPKYKRRNFTFTGSPPSGFTLISSFPWLLSQRCPASSAVDHGYRTPAGKQASWGLRQSWILSDGMIFLKDDAVKVLHSICQQIWKTQQWPQDWKRSVLIPIPKKSNAKECSNYRTIALISHASKVMLKILHGFSKALLKLQQYVNYELPDVQAGFRKGR